MTIYNNIVSFFQSGGTFMYPIVVVLALGLAIAVERYLFLSYAALRNRKAWNDLMPLLRSGKFREAQGIVEQSGAAISKILSYGLASLIKARRRDDVQRD